MRTMRWWWGMLCVAGMACADDPVVGARPDAARVSADLDFVLPMVREMPSVLRGSDVGAGEADLAEIAGADAMVQAEGSYPFIWTTFLRLAFDSTRLKYEYGMTGFGSGYTMTPSLTVLTSSGDRSSVSAGPGRSEDLFYAWRFKPTMHGYADMSRDCGMVATMHVLFEARMAGRIVNTSREQRSEQTSATAPPCPPAAPTGTGGTPVGTTYYLTVCSYELWVDLDGNIVDLLFLGCSTVPLPQMQ